MVDAPQGKVTKVLPLVRFKNKLLLVSGDAVVCLKLLATTLADKHMATALPNYVLVRRFQRLESVVTYITRVTPLSLSLSLSLSYALSPHTDSIQQPLKFPHKPALDIFRLRCTPPHVLL